MKRCIRLCALVVLSSQLSFTQHIAKYAGEFLSLGVGGRALALGGSYVALGQDGFACYWNPAALARIDYPEIVLMHEERFAGLINYDFGSASIPVGKENSIGIGVLRLGVDNIADTRLAGIDVNGNPIPPDQYENAVRLDYSKITYFTAADWAFYFTYAQRSKENFSYGVNVKVIYHSIASESALGIGFDAGILYSPRERWWIGVNAQDITTTLVAWSTGTNELISPTIKIGTAYFLDFLKGTFAPTVDCDVRFENRRTASVASLGPISFDPHVGLEYDYKHAIAIRVGYSDVKQLTLGAGLHLRKLDIDYAFARFGEENSLGDTHRISLRLLLQEERFSRR
jgi:hypothetical protein